MSRKPGRPRVLERKRPVSAWVPTATLDQLAKVALKNDVSLSTLVSRLIENALRVKPK